MRITLTFLIIFPFLFACNTPPGLDELFDDPAESGFAIGDLLREARNLTGSSRDSAYEICEILETKRSRMSQFEKHMFEADITYRKCSAQSVSTKSVDLFIVDNKFFVDGSSAGFPIFRNVETDQNGILENFCPRLALGDEADTDTDNNWRTSYRFYQTGFGKYVAEAAYGKTPNVSAGNFRVYQVELMEIQLDLNRDLSGLISSQLRNTECEDKSVSVLQVSKKFKLN